MRPGIAEMAMALKVSCHFRVLCGLSRTRVKQRKGWSECTSAFPWIVVMVRPFPAPLSMCPAAQRRQTLRPLPHPLNTPPYPISATGNNPNKQPLTSLLAATVQ